MKMTIKVALLAFASTLAIELNKVFLSHEVNKAVSYILAIGVSVFGVRILDYLLLDYTMKYKAFRKVSDPRARLEGYWLLRIQGDFNRPFALHQLSMITEPRIICIEVLHITTKAV